MKYSIEIESFVSDMIENIVGKGENTSGFFKAFADRFFKILVFVVQG